MVEGRPPLVVACAGGTARARLAGRVAAALERLGVAEAVEDAERAVTEAGTGRRLVALDGCASACRARLLEARGAPPESALSLDELGADARTPAAGDAERLARAAAARLRSPRGLARPTSRTRRPGPAPAPRAKWAHTVDDYLVALDALASAPVACGALAVDAPTVAAHISRLLAVSPAAGGETLARLVRAGLVERGQDKQLLLTGAGRAAADRAVRRHRLLECFLCDYLGYPAAECYASAQLLGEAFDEEAVAHLRAALGDPDRCPHGWPVDPQRARAESRDLVALSTLSAGGRAAVVRLTEHEGALLAHLHALGVAPETRLEVERRLRSGGLIVRVGGRTRRFEPAAAAAVFVHRRARGAAISRGAGEVCEPRGA